MPSVLLFIAGLLLFQLLIVLHEFGHFLVAKWNGVEVEEFGLGFPPRIAGKKLGKGIFRAYYSINWLPIGGFVKLKGEHSAASGKGTYGSCSLNIKAKIILAGVAANFVFAVFVFTVLAATGIPQLLPAEPITHEQQFTVASDTKIIDSRLIIIAVEDDSPAAISGIHEGDQVQEIGEREIDSHEDLQKHTTEFAGQDVNVIVLRDGQPLGFRVQFITEEEVANSRRARQQCLERSPSTSECPVAKGYLGIYATDFVLQRSTWSAPVTGFMLGLQYTKVTLQGVWHVITSLFVGDTATAGDSVTGPVGIIFILRESANYGLAFVLMIIALLSITLAVMNTLPIPALDGGRLALTILFQKILKRPPHEEYRRKSGWLQYGFAIDSGCSCNDS